LASEDWSGGITISKALLGGGKEESAKLAAVMSHEGTHVNGNRIERFAHQQANNTYEAIKAIFGLRGDAEFSAKMANAINDPDSWKVNTGNVDKWEKKKNGSLFDDGKDGVISFEDGRAAINTVNKGKQGSLEEYLELESGEGYRLLMREAGFVYDEKTKTWNSGKTISADAIKNLVAKGIISADLIAETEPQADGDVSDLESEQSFMRRVAAAAWDKITGGASAVGSFFGGLFKRKETRAPVKEETTLPDELQNYEYILTKEQLDKFVTPEFYEKYKAVVKQKTKDPLEQLNALSTQCNIFIDALIKGFGDDVYKDIMPNGSQSPNELYNTWNGNSKLLQLKNGDEAWVKAQEYANQGYIVLSAASDNKNHVALVLPNWGYQYNPLPDTDWKQREEYAPDKGKINYSGTIKHDWPAFLQSGSYTGIVSPRWAYSPDIIRDGQVHFYVYKREGKK
jgi:hypothetical protein